ncbi:MAG: metallopeptidase TldD-related protein [Gemmatimonadales bacterium]
MIGAVLTDLARRVDHADLVGTTDHTLLAVVAAGGSGLGEDGVDTIQVRVAAGGRTGWAGGAGAEADAVGAAAIRSAAVGDPARLFFPAAADVPVVETRSPAAAALDAPGVADLARQLYRLAGGRDRIVETWVERSVGSVSVANTRGVQTSYDTSLVGFGIEARAARGGPVVRLHQAAAGVPTTADLARLADDVIRALEPPVIEAEGTEVTRVWFAPRAVRALLTPVLAGLIGERWLAGRDTRPALDARITIVDDPLAAGRPGSRPICDDGVPSRRLTLVDRGIARQGILDLVTGSRRLLPATGHGWRRGMAAGRTGFTNVRLAAGSAESAEIAREAGDGVLVLDAAFGPAPDPATGVFRMPVPWAYRLANGVVAGRLDGGVLVGDAFELLRRVVAVGRDTEWIGACEAPSLVVDGVRLELG